jgi:hypothetical protein
MPKNKDPIPDHLKFGYAHNLECDQNRADLIAGGMDPKDPMMVFAVSNQHMKNHANDLTYRERQEIWKAENAVKQEAAKIKALAASNGTKLALTWGEIEFILEKLAGTNDPVGVDIMEKLSGAILERNHAIEKVKK